MAIEVRSVCTLILVFDMPTALNFYRDVLGFVVQATSGSASGGESDWCHLKLGDANLMLNGMYEAHERPTVPDPRRNAVHEDTCLYFACPDVDATYRHLQAKGIEVEEPQVAPYGMKQLYLRDPDGYNLCFQWEHESPSR